MITGTFNNEADYCSGVQGNDDHRCVCNDGNLGPKNVADGSSPAALIEGYNRIGDLKPAEFLAKWCVTIYPPGKARETKWLWPNATNDGFVLKPDGSPDKRTIELEPGTLIDRFGHDDTTYFAPFRTLYAQRSLPPSNLNIEYGVYEVKRKLPVSAGLIAPGFEQPGLGTQYVIDTKVLSTQELFHGSTWLRKLTVDEVKALYTAGT